MKAIVLSLNNQTALGAAHQQLDRVPLDGSVEFVLRNAQRARSLQQLGALFGVWIQELLQQCEGWDEQAMHRWLKEQHLVDIYANEPVGDWQNQWAELYWFYMEKCDPSVNGGKLDANNKWVKKMAAHIQRISIADVSGITHEQMGEYMDRVYKWGISQGFRLSEPNKFYKEYRAEIKRQRQRGRA